MELYNKAVTMKLDSFQRRDEGVRLANQLVYWTNEADKAFSLDSLSRSARLFFYFSYETCSPCIDMSIKLIEQIAPNYDTDESIVFITPDSPSVARDRLFKKKLLRMKAGRLGLYIEDVRVVFFFSIDENMKIRDMHIVNRENIDRTKKYLERKLK